MSSELTVIYFNNCHNRDHVALFGSGAFFDLGTSGRQATQARNLHPGQPCVVAEWSPDKQIVFDWYLLSNQFVIPDEHGVSARVFFGRLFATETMTKEAAAKSDRYTALFRSTGHLKIGSVFRKTLPTSLIPDRSDEDAALIEDGPRAAETSAGFGDSAENKLVEAAAIRTVINQYKQNGWSFHSVERDRCGFDLEFEKDGEIEQVEVKGVRGSELAFVITAGEVKQARTNPKFFLVVVTSALTSSPALRKFSGEEFGHRFDLSAIQYRASLKR